jgi:hypothetical protein
MNEMTSITPTSPLPRIASVEVVDHLVVRVTWRDGIRAERTDVVDLAPMIRSLKFYKPLRENRDLFRTVHLIENGRAIAWQDDEIDMPAVSLEQLAQEGMAEDSLRHRI